jgi:THO complex subunit 7
MKKFHAFSVAEKDSPEGSSAILREDAREAFLLELSSYELALRKNTLICDAESRQIEEYESEKRRISMYPISLAPESASLYLAEHNYSLPSKRTRKLAWSNRAA